VFICKNLIFLVNIIIKYNLALLCCAGVVVDNQRKLLFYKDCHFSFLRNPVINRVNIVPYPLLRFKRGTIPPGNKSSQCMPLFYPYAPMAKSAISVLK